MARLARIAVPGCPHHVTAQGNRREPIFFEDRNQDIYCDMLAEQTRKAKVEDWAYCLMPNHVHLILRPTDERGLSQAVGAAHRRWANFINGRSRWRGHLFDNRFASVAMDENHLISAARNARFHRRAGTRARPSCRAPRAQAKTDKAAGGAEKPVLNGEHWYCHPFRLSSVSSFFVSHRI
jgi:REP element-mobilizing transposase RayT